MPTRLSKFTIEDTCKQYVHPWSDSCISTTAGLGLHAMQECLRIYSTLYFVTLLTKGRIPTLDDLKKTFISIIQSTAFLSWSAFAYSGFICLFRRFLKFNVFTVSFIPSFFSSLTAILLERPSRRPLLCLYVSNIATETLFRMAVSRGYASAIPHGEVLVFAAGMATLLYFFKSKAENRDSIYKLFRIGLGPYEEKGYENRLSSQSQRSTNSSEKDENKKKKPSKSIFDVISHALRIYKQLIDKIKLIGGKNLSCPHPHGCLHYALSGSLKMFGIGSCIQIGLRLVFQMKSLLFRPTQFKKILFKKGTFDLAWFLGGFAGLYKLASCLLRRTNNEDTAKNALIAGLIASTSFVMYPDNTIALYVAWKALQLLWNDGVEKGKVPEVKWFVIFLYSFSTAVLFHAAIVEPENLRLSYWKFLYNLSGGRVAMMSRIPIDGFGMESQRQLRVVLDKSRTHNNHVYSF